MAVQLNYPGVYIQEQPSGVRTITGVSTSIALFVGMVQRGPMDTAVNVLSFTDYRRSFGSDTTVSETTDQVRQFFLNGGRQAYIIRIARGEQAASAVLLSESGAAVLRLTAAEAGRIGESIRVEVSYATAEPEATFSLLVGREVIDSAGNVTLVETETLSDLSMNPNAARYVQTTVAQTSRLIRAEVLDPSPAPFTGYSMSGRAEADWLAALNAQLATQNNIGRFQVAVDGGPPVSVLLNGPLAAIADIQTAINTALGSLGAVVVEAVAIPGGAEQVLRIRSTADGGQVRILPGASGDLANPMHLGTANDGLEVDGHAARRPAPTGLFASLGDLDTASGTWLNRFAAFLRAHPADLPNIVVKTSLRVETYPIAGIASPSFWEAVPAAGTRLRYARGALQRIVQQIASAPNAHYTPALQGFRLVLNPTFASFIEQETAVVSTSGAYAIGDPNTGYLGHHAHVRRAPLGAFTNNPHWYVAGGNPGQDGDKPELSDYQDAFAVAARTIDIFNLLILPKVLRDGKGSSQSDADRAPLWGPASAFCRDERAFLIIDPPQEWTRAQDALLPIANLRVGVVGDHAMIAWPQLRVADPVTGVLRSIDPAGSVAGVAARIDGTRGVWKAPAGLESGILGVRGVAHCLSDAENGLLNPQAVNAIRQFPNGVVIWGSRTLAGFDNSGENDYKYVPVRRVALFIEESLYRDLQWAVFEPNDEPLWAQIRLAAGAFMNNLFRQGAFQGQRASDAYFVKCDAETTTQNDINLGIVNVVVGFAPLRPAEFVVITIHQLAGQVQT